MSESKSSSKQLGRLGKIQYRFKDASLLRTALTHRSVGGVNNERLEFLGDSVLSMIVTKALYYTKVNCGEGSLSRHRAHLVSRETCCVLAKKLHIPAKLRLGSGIEKLTDYMIGNALEAIIGAIYLEAGMETVEKEVLRWYEKYMNSPFAEDTSFNSKSALQEWAQKLGLQLPVYTVNRTGADHEPLFHAVVSIPDINMEAKASAGSRQKAEKAAAELLFNRVKNSNLNESPFSFSKDDSKTAKTRLNEFTQSLSCPPPQYVTQRVSDLGGRPHFETECRVQFFAKLVGRGKGSSKKAAEQQAASDFLQSATNAPPDEMDFALSSSEDVMSGKNEYSDSEEIWD